MFSYEYALVSKTHPPITPYFFNSNVITAFYDSVQEVSTGSTPVLYVLDYSRFSRWQPPKSVLHKFLQGAELFRTLVTSIPKFPSGHFLSWSSSCSSNVHIFGTTAGSTNPRRTEKNTFLIQLHRYPPLKYGLYY